MHDIFLSYATQDRDRVRPLVAALEQEGWSVFWDQDIHVGEKWRDRISGELEAARAVVVAWSRHSEASDWVPGEAQRARERGRLFPVVVDDMAPPLGFDGIQTARLIDWDGKPDAPALQGLLRALRPALARPRDQSGASDERRRARPRIFVPTWKLPTPLKAGIPGLAAAWVLAGFLVERGYAVLLGVTLDTSAATLLSSGTFFFLTLLLMVASVPFLAVLFLALLAGILLRRVGRDWPWLAALRARFDNAWALNACLALAVVVLAFYAIASFADLLPIVAVRTGEGPGASAMAKLRHGAGLYRRLVVMVALSVLLLLGVIAWMRRLRGAGRLAGVGWTLSRALLAVMASMVALELLVLPVAHGLLRVPSGREYVLLRVAFKETAIDGDLRGRELLLVRLPSQGQAWTLYCPKGAQGRPVVFWVDPKDIEDSKHESSGPLAALLDRFANRTGCQLSDIRLGALEGGVR